VQRLVEGNAWWPPIVVWAGALASLVAVALATGHDPWQAGTWARWDSGHYVEIARNGYEIHRCDSATGWCGDTAWLPAYPGLMAALHVLGVPYLVAGVAIAATCSAAALFLLWGLFLRELPTPAAVGGLLFAGFAPGLVYGYAVYPLSLLVVCSIAFLHFMRDGRWVAAGLAAASATLAYPLGAALSLVALGWLALTLRRDRLRTAATCCGPSVLAFLALLATQRIQTGRWSAYFDVERTYDHGLHDPLGAVTNAVRLWSRTQTLQSENIKALQTLFVSAVVVAVVAHAILRYRRLTRVDLLFCIWAVVTWAVPLTQGNISTQRSQAALVPIAVLVARLPRPLLATAVLLTAAISIPLAWVYFQGSLV
jgi:hypothetical protein